MVVAVFEGGQTASGGPPPLGGVDAALRADEGLASSAGYRETDERRFDLLVLRATGRPQIGEPREPEPPDYSMFA